MKRTAIVVIACLGLLVGMIALGGLRPATAAVTGDASHDYTGDGTTADADGGTAAVWNGTAAYDAGHTGALGDDSFSVSPNATLSIPGGDVGDVGTADFGLSVWVKLTDSDAVQEILAKRSDCVSGDAFLDLRAQDTRGVVFELQDAANPSFNVTNPTNVLDGTWHHIVAIRRGDTVTLAVDKSPVSATTNGVVDIDNTAPLTFDDGGCVGSSGDGTVRSTGDIDDVQLGPAPTGGSAALPTTSASASATQTGQVQASGGATPSAASDQTATAPAGARGSSKPHSGGLQPHHRQVGTRQPTPTPARSGRPSVSASGQQPQTPEANPSYAVAPPIVSRTTQTPAAAAFEVAVPSLKLAFGSLPTVGKNLLLAAILLALLGLPVTLVNRTALVNADELAALSAGVRRRLPLHSRTGSTRERLPDAALLGLAAVASGVLYGFLEPTFSFSMSSLALVFGLILGLITVGLTKELIRAFVLRRVEVSVRFRLFPGFVFLAVGCVLISRLTGLQPGLLLGTFVGLATVRQLRAVEDGPAVLASYLGIAIIVVASLGLRAVIETHVTGTEDFGVSVVITALTAVIASGIEAMAFDLIPLRFLHGFELFHWSKFRWLGLFLLGLFGFVDLLLHPSSSNQDLLHHASYLGRLVAIYFVVAIAFWAWFRFRPERYRPN